MRSEARGGWAARLALELAIGVVLLLAGRALLPDRITLDDVGPQIDECGWLAVSHETYQLYGRHLPTGEEAPREAWRQGLQRTTFGAMNPNFAKLGFGFVLERMGYDLPPPRVFPGLYPEARGRIGSPGWLRSRIAEHAPYLERLRALNVWVMAACGVLLYGAGWLLGGRLLGLLAWFGFLTTPLVQDLSFRLLTDNVLLWLNLVSLLATTLVLDRWTRQRDPLALRAAALAGVGVVLGLTTATKLNGAMACVAFGVALVGLWAAGRLREVSRWEPVVWAAATATVAIGTFIALHPLLWGDVAGELAAILAQWERTLAAQQHDYASSALVTLPAKTAAVWRVAIQGMGPWGPALGPWLGPVLFAAGLGLLARHATRALTRARTGARTGALPGASTGRDASVHAWVIASWALVWIVSTVLWVPLDWERYYLPAAVPAGLIAMLPLAEAIRWGRERLLPEPSSRNT